MEIIGVTVISDTIDFANKYSGPPLNLVSAVVDGSVWLSDRRNSMHVLSNLVETYHYLSVNPASHLELLTFPNISFFCFWYKVLLEI